VLAAAAARIRSLLGLLGEVELGLGRIVTLYHRLSNSHRIREHIRCLYF
jgi:hypothetical protein